jgi:acyl carrier protein
MAMRQPTVEDRVKEIVAKVFHRNVDMLNRNTHFVEDLKVNPFTLNELIADLEVEFGMDIPKEEVRRSNTIGETVDSIENWLSK